MIKVVLGLPGSGKTLYMLWLMQQYVNSGRLVASNIRLTDRCPFKNAVALLDDDEGKFPVCTEGDKKKKESYRAWWHYLGPNWVIFIDEADTYFDSSDYRDLQRDVRIYFKQHRKLRHDIILSVQNVDNLYVRVRRMVQAWVLCDFNRRSSRLMQWLPGDWSRFLRAEYGTPQLRDDSLLGTGYFWMNEARQMFSWYDTEQLLGSTNHYAEWLQQKGPAHAAQSPSVASCA